MDLFNNYNYDDYNNNNNNNYEDYDNYKYHNTKIILSSAPNDNDYTIEAYMYNNHTQLSYVKKYIYLFWKKEFAQTDTTNTTMSSLSTSFNPFVSWTLSEVVRHNMGLKDNTLCVQVVVCDVPIGFCCVLLLDEFDRSDRMSPFSHEMYHDSAVLYNFVLDKPFRGNGYGTKLLQAIIRHMAQKYHKYKYLTLYVDKDNMAAIKMYEKHHFVLLGDNPTNPAAAIYRLTLTLTLTF
jgi:RimJ/RimL family protein N-acetyltransferase